MALVGHLAELRKRLVVATTAVGVGAIAGFFLWNWVLGVATHPYCAAQAARGINQIAGGSSCQLYISNPLELFTTRLTVSGYLGLFLAAPVVLYQLWRFITPGLEAREKRYGLPFVFTSILLFGFGGVMAWLAFPKAIEFFLAVGGNHVLTLFSPGPYLKLLFLMIVIFGAVFELPVLLVFLQLARAVSSTQLRAWRRPAIVINFVVAAIATPSPDPWSFFAMAIPLVVFYEIAILVGRICKK